MTLARRGDWRRRRPRPFPRENLGQGGEGVRLGLAHGAAAGGEGGQRPRPEGPRPGPEAPRRGSTPLAALP